MPLYFLDSSALLKRYHAEAGTAELDRIMMSPGSHCIISRLALVEVPSGLARLVREGTLTSSQFQHLIARLHADLASRTLWVAALNRSIFEGATSILSSYGLTQPIRTLDALQLATALAIHARRPLAALVAADHRLLTVASQVGKLATTQIG